MSEPSIEQLLQSVRPDPNAPPETAESLAEKLPGFPPQAIEEALRMLTLSGVLREEKLPDGRTGYRYEHPERYRMINTPVIKQPGPDFGKRSSSG
jgi:hypothetical protein